MRSLNKFGRPTGGLRGSIILTSTRVTSRRKKNSKRSRKPTTSSATRRSAKFTISTASTQTRFRRALMRLTLGARRSPLRAVLPSIFPALIFLTSFLRKTAAQDSGRLSAISSLRYSPVAERHAKQLSGRPVAATSSIECTWLLGRHPRHPSADNGRERRTLQFLQGQGLRQRGCSPMPRLRRHGQDNEDSRCYALLDDLPAVRRYGPRTGPLSGMQWDRAYPPTGNI